MAIMHIDMNSYFATVEQQANPLLRGKPIAVSGRPNIHSVVATASYEAKKFGVRAGMSTWEAKKLCPNLIFIPGDPNKYIDITGRLIKIFKSYSPLIEVFSIDEVFLDLGFQQIEADQADAVAIAQDIKKRIKSEIGDKMTCSIGVASNKFLAKLASEKKKPDGLTVIDGSNLDEMLLTSKLEDFCGIGRRILKRLNNIGVYSVEHLRKMPKDILVCSFGNVCGTNLHNMAYGVDHSPVVPDHEADEAKSYSHSLTLPKETDDRGYVEAVLLRLSEKVARRMRADSFCGRVVHLYSEQKLLPRYVSDGLEIFEEAKKLLLTQCHPEFISGSLANASVSETSSEMPDQVRHDTRLPFQVRMLSVGISYLQKDYLLTKSLLPENQRMEKIVTSMDFVNNKFGENSVFRAAVLPAFEREKNVAGIRMKLRFQ